MIDKEFTFHKTGWDIPTTQAALSHYNSNKKEYANWLYDSDIKIFLDTNILINLYTISQSQRKQLLKFLKKNQNRIYLTEQVSKEYLKHRLSKAQGIRDAYKCLSNQYKDVLESTLKNLRNALKNFETFSSKSIIIDDLPDTSAALQTFCDKIRSVFTLTEDLENELQNDSTAIIDSFDRETGNIISGLQYEYVDPILDIIANLNVLPSLEPEELSYLKESYDTLLDEFNSVKDDKAKKDAATFPGCGDRKKNSNEQSPYGDFIIYHEMLKFIKEQQEDVLFITRDITKSDWIRLDKRPFVHYIIDMYGHTQHLIFIIPANEFFPVSFASLTPESQAEDIPPQSEAEDNVQSVSEESEKPAEESKEAVTNPIADIKETSIKRPKLDVSNVSVSFLYDYLMKHVLYPADSPDESESIENGDTEYLRDITRERFINELQTAIKWAQTYGNKYVSENLFIYDILKSKRFRYASSRAILKELIDDGTVIQKMENHNNKTIPCLYLPKQTSKKK